MISDAQLSRAVTAARKREAQGYFDKVKAGDQRAAALFAQLVANDLNPLFDMSDFANLATWSDYGRLTKQPGEAQVDGYAEDSIVFGADPADLMNVVDLINGAGAPDASIGGAVKPRRSTNLWAAPKPLTDEELTYLRPVAVPVPPAILPPGREEALDEMNWLDGYYASPEGLQRPNGLSLAGKPDFEGIAAWYLDVYQRERMAGKSRTDARAAYVTQIRHSAEWQAKHPGVTP